MTRVFRSADELGAARGEVLGTSEWLTVDRARIDLFAESTGASAYLALALVPRLSRTVWTVEGASMAVNAGVNRVRFPRSVTAGSRVRLTSTVVSTRRLTTAVHLVLDERIDLEGSDEPACTAETVTLVSF